MTKIQMENEPSEPATASTSSTPSADKDPTTLNDTEPKQTHQIRSTRRSASRSSISSSASASSSSTTNSLTKTRTRTRLKQKEDQDDENIPNIVKFDLGSASNESLSLSLSSSSTTSISTIDQQKLDNEINIKNTRKSLQLLNNKSSIDIQPQQDSIPINLTPNGLKRRGRKPSLKPNKSSQLKHIDEEKILENNNSNENSQNLTTCLTKKQVCNLDENTLDGLNLNSANLEADVDVDVEGFTNSTNLENKDKKQGIVKTEFVSETSLCQTAQEPKKKRRRKTSLIPDCNSDGLKPGGHITVALLFVYKWPAEEEDDESEEEDDPGTKAGLDKYSRIFLTGSVSDLFILQEQVSEYLGVKSFKRKYPDIYRRFIDIKEREFLKKNRVVTETQCDLGLTALRLTECFDLMADDYPEKYKEFDDYFNEKRRRAIAAAALQAATHSLNRRKSEMGASTFNVRPSGSKTALSEADRMKEMIKKAMKSVVSYNSQLQKEKCEERKTFFDLQTMRLQEPCRQLSENSEEDKLYINNKKGKYPVALLPGQYQYYYKNYTTDELKYMPVNTIIYTPPTPTPFEYIEWKRQLTKPDLSNNQTQRKQPENPSTTRKLIEIKPSQKYDSSEDESNKTEFTPVKASNESNKKQTSSLGSLATLVSASSTQSIRAMSSGTPTVAKLISSSNKTCCVCQKASLLSTSSTHIDNNQLMVSCSSCPRYSHPNCLELNPKLVDWTCIRNYDWQCMECKKCSKCSNANDEDKMMFCDRCDRGFHTFCVGMSQVPTGSWLCKSCTEFNEKLNAIQEKINMSKSNHGSDNNVSITTPTKLSLKSKLNCSISTTPTLLTPYNERRGRGRPPGSLNKPKDPNSPKKQLKSTKPVKLNGDSSGFNGNMSMNVNSQFEDFNNDSLTYENSYEQYAFVQFNTNSTTTTSKNVSQSFYHLDDETSTNSQFQFN